ncbi:MAG: hypothetical protein FIB01_05335 [Gemmatimonadetes bacterium]|nr:hypothetical protein [Gemmatimonadota bacterium]
MSRWLAWHLPGVPVRAGAPVAGAGDGTVVAPALSPEDVARAAELARAAGARLRATPLDDVSAAIDHVARRFLDPADPLRREALQWLPAVTGYDPAMAALVLDRMAADWTEPALRRLLRAEFRDPRALERFVAHAPGQRARAIPPRLVFHVLAGNVPGVGVTSLVRGLLVRAPALCKTARGEPVLPVLFARAFADCRPALAEALQVAWWPGGDHGLEAPALAAADLVIHYGDAPAIADLRGRAPATVRVVEHGPRISFGVIAREHAHRRAVAAAAARATALFDQQGCVSPHLFYVEEGGRVEPRTFAARVAAQLEAIGTELPRGQLSIAEAAAVQQLRAAVEFRAIAGQQTGLWTGGNLAWTVAFDPDPAFAASCLGRFLRIKPIARLEDVLGELGSYRAALQTVAVSAPPARAAGLAEAFAGAGCTRITSLAAMPFPPPSWHHDGRGPLRELVRWVDWER